MSTPNAEHEVRQSSATQTGRSSAAPGMRRLPKWKLLLFSIVPATALVLAAEAALRVYESYDPEIKRPFMIGEVSEISRRDEDLFWSLVPDLDTTFVGKRLTTNRLGLRGAAINPKKEGEFRILSLGESTTFGQQVRDEETYSARLEDILQERFPDRAIRVINAGVPSYTSFQSLIYLKERGLALKPDMVLFYHEFNDFLPASHRVLADDPLSLAQSDRERYRSMHDRVHRRLLAWSAIYRRLASFYAMKSIEAVQNDETNASHVLLTPAFQRQNFQQQLVESGRDDGKVRLKRRVTPAEHLEILRELVEVCGEHDIALVVIHPSYEFTRPHACVLLEFSEDENVPLYEAQEALHPPGADGKTLFADFVHPSAAGHRRLAEGLARFLVEEGLLPGTGGDASSATISR